MSGDVQPRKRKDKKRKKDELGVEEPRGTAAVLGEGDVFMHSQHEHGTGGHWCAKIIFFSLLAVLVTLIGLIILENRGLTELEANSVESRYSGVLDGWLEDAPDDDHHDEHTLELLKNHDDEDNQDQGHDISEEDQDETEDHDENQTDQDENDDEEDNDDDHDDVKDHDSNDEEASDEDEQDDNDDDDEHDNEEDDEEQNENGEQNIYNKNQDDSNENSEEQQLDADEADDDDDEEPPFDNDDSGEDNEDDDLQKVDEVDSEEDNDQSNEVADESVEKDDDINSREDEDDDEEHEENGEEETDSAIELEKLEKEVSDEDISEEQPTQEAEEDDKSQEVSSELPPEDNVYDADVDNLEDEEYLEPDIDEPLPVIERIVAPKGKPLPEVEDETTTTKPADTLADEEEYEKQQEELRREQAQASHVWLKLAVGGALLVATHAVVSRAVAPRDETPASDGHAIREDTPLIDRRMTLVPEEPPVNEIQTEVIEEIVRPVIDFKKSSQNQPVTPPSKEESEEEIEEEEEEIIDRKDITRSAPVGHVEKRDKELFSEDEDADEAEEEEEVIIEQKKVTPEQAPTNIEKAVESEPEEVEIEEDVPDDVEIIDDEHLEEELEEEEDEEEISDVDDAELLTRLEAKYGRLPEPERGHKHKDGGNSVEDDWPGEPSDKYWRQQLDEAEQELRQGAWSAAMTRAAAAQLRGSARARWILARAVDAQAEAQRDNRLLSRAIAAYLDVLKLNERLTDDRLRHIASRTLDRIRFRGNYLSAEPIYRLLIRRFPDVVDYRNNLTVTFLMANRADLAEQVIKETLKTWPNDRVALAHMGFILKTQHNRLEEAVEALQKALEGDVGPATESRFYYHLGDSLLLLNRFTEAHEVHKRGAKLGHFLSPAQRSLYNVNRLKSRPWWDIEQTPYVKLARALEKSWKEILKEGRAAQALYEKEKEGLKERGEWSQLDLFVRGQEVPGRCKQAPVTCSVVRAEKAAAGCRRGQVKFSAMEAGTHVRPHVGPTNCRLRMHLGLSNTKDTYIRVDKETRQWQVGKVFMFDDSFEHEVWHNGTGTRLVLIVDVWHPALSADERRDLPPI